MVSTPLTFPLAFVLLIIASSVAMLVKWWKIPYAIALVLTGLAISVFHLLPPIEMTPEVILNLFLPALLFEAAWNMDLHQLRENWLAIGFLSTVGVVISMLTIAWLMNFSGQMPVSLALLFGAIISATDPVSVLAIFKKLGVNERLTTIMEAESLFNDGTAVTLFQLTLLSALGTSFTAPQALQSFLYIFLGGMAVGILVGFTACKVISLFDDHLLELTFTTIVAYGSCLTAEKLGMSPVISIVAAGLVFGSYGKKNSISSNTKFAINTFWEYVAFVVNSFIFLLIGLQINLKLFVQYANLIVIGIFAILASRIIAVYLLSAFVSTKKRPLPLHWRHILFWGALRGSLSMALALCLPVDFAMRQELITLTFAVVLFTLLVQGLTIEPLVIRLRSRYKI